VSTRGFRQPAQLSHQNDTIGLVTVGIWPLWIPWGRHYSENYFVWPPYGQPLELLLTTIVFSSIFEAVRPIFSAPLQTQAGAVPETIIKSISDPTILTQPTDAKTVLPGTRWQWGNREFKASAHSCDQLRCSFPCKRNDAYAGSQSSLDLCWIVNWCSGPHLQSIRRRERNLQRSENILCAHGNSEQSAWAADGPRGRTSGRGIPFDGWVKAEHIMDPNLLPLA